MPIIRRHAHPPVDTGLGAVFLPKRAFSTEVYARDLHLEMRAMEQGGVNIAPMAWGMFDLRSTFEFIPPAGVPALSADPYSQGLEGTGGG